MDRSSLALSAVRSKPGCTAWSLSLLVDPPAGMSAADWLALLDEELPKLHAAGTVRATKHGIERVRYWPARFEVPELAGEIVACS